MYELISTLKKINSAGGEWMVNLPKSLQARKKPPPPQVDREHTTIFSFHAYLREKIDVSWFDKNFNVCFVADTSKEFG